MDKSQKLKDFLTKLQNLPDKQKRVILWSVVVFFALTMGVFWFNSAINRFSKIGESVGSINVPSLNLPSTDLLQTTTPSNENPVVQVPSNQTNDWIKCVGNCDFYVDKVLGEIINKKCIDACNVEYKLDSKYKYLDSAILFLSPEVKVCNNISTILLKDECLYKIPQKYLINQ